MTEGSEERLAEVTGAILTVAVKAAQAGCYTAELGRILAAAVAEVGARIAADAELRGFAGGWQEAMACTADLTPPPQAPAPARRQH